MFRTREIAGWLLVLGGLYLIYEALVHVGNRRVVEASVVVFAAMAVLRGGIHLVKVATAAHICLAAERRGESNGQN